MVRARFSSFLLPVFLASAAASAWADNAPERIGVAAAVRNEVIGVQAQGQRALSVGSPLFRNELIRTGENGVAQLLFADQTTISMGSRSELRLDQFVYNPSQNAGQVVFEFARGAMRFISGAQDPHSYSVRTPVATIGVRGTIVDFLLIDGKLIAILDEGRALFTLPDGRELELNEPGTAFEFLPGGGVSGPAPWTGRYETGLRVASFPLYGSAFADLPDHEGAQPTDHLNDIKEELALRRLQVTAPSGEDDPPPDAGEEGGGDSGPPPDDGPHDDPDDHHDHDWGDHDHHGHHDHDGHDHHDAWDHDRHGGWDRDDGHGG
ncbi:MAG: FecR domain-containing protein, partial [Hyphomonadaceae bacterium]